MKEFDKDSLNFYLPEKFKGMDKEYMLSCIFNDNIQFEWKPGVGDVIIGITGNIFIISVVDYLSDNLGGTRYYYGGGSCTNINNNILDDTYYYTANERGDYIHPLNGLQKNLNHSSIRDFKYVPYPHELK